MDPVKFIHTAEGKLIPDDPFVVEGTEVRLVKKDDYHGWTKSDLGIVGVITEKDIERTIKRRNTLDHDGPEAVYTTWTFDTDEEDFSGPVDIGCIEVIENG